MLVVENTFVNNPEEAKKLFETRKVIFATFKCDCCKQIKSRKLYRLSLQNFNLICTKCSRVNSVKSTKLQRYGSENYNNMSKNKQTKLKNHGTVNYNNHKQAVQTNLKKYGVENVSSCETVKAKKAQKCLQKYGVSNNFRASEIKTKTKQTNLRKYGVEFPAQSKNIRLKQLQSSAQKYFFENEYFDSSWELALWIYAKDHNENIIREPVKLQYSFQNEQHIYFPDFEYKGKLLEIKNDRLFRKMQQSETLENAKLKCMLDNQVSIWRLQEIKPILKYINETYPKNYLKGFKGKLSN